MQSTFLTNESTIKFLDKIKDSLTKCNEFHFSVSFIKKAGLVLLSKEIEEALVRGVQGRIITSTYQNFTDPSSLIVFKKWMDKYDNFKCHLDLECFGEQGFHTKGYLFNYDDYSELIVGSSNITRYALLKNKEWNISIYSKENKNAINDSIIEFNNLWNKTYLLENDLIEKYGKMFDYAISRWDMDIETNFLVKIKPNYMQLTALKEIAKLRGRGIDKALIIAATGSGKTYLSAFDAKNYDAKRLLFVVHRDTILNEAMNTYKKVFGTSREYGIYNGKNKNLDIDFVFASNLTLEKNLDMFKNDEFDYIVIDEVHHAIASTYQKILNYFKPGFLLGLTATPERMDEKSVFDIFENNVPYELRLRDALINNLIVPFKYYGIDDTFVDYSESDTNKLVRQIANNLHCEFVKENILKYKQPGKLKALGFCRNIEHARLMSEEMNNLGFKTTFLTGKDDTGIRIANYNALQSDTNDLEIIFSVDILNEGIDIPAVNMVLFLRPTDSSTIFTQQLGRGLRKFEGKEYLTVLDFIGNSYKRSVQIALALGGLAKNNNIDKRLLALFVRNNFCELDLPIEINLDEQSKEKILDSIASTSFHTKIILEQEYHSFKKYLHKEYALKHMDYLNSEVASDIMKCINKYGCFYNFLLEIKEDVPLFDELQINFLKYLSSFFPLVRPYEFMIVKELINGKKNKKDLEEAISLYDKFDKESFEHALSNLEYKFFSEKERKLKTKFINNENNDYSLIMPINDVYIEYVNDLLDYGLTKYNIDFYNVNDKLNLYYTYDRTSLLTVLNHHTLACREGIVFVNKEVYFFIDLNKDLDIEEWLKYEDKFINKDLLQWESQTETTLDNSKGLKLLSYQEAHLFVRKVKKEDGIVMPYIYIGKGKFTNARTSKNPKKAILIDLKLEHSIPEYLRYDFEIEDKEDE